MRVPIVRIEIAVLAQFIGDVMADLTSRGAQLLGLEPIDDGGIVLARIPQSELRGYGEALRALTHASAVWSTDFSHYEEGPDDTSGVGSPLKPGPPSRSAPASAIPSEPPPDEPPDAVSQSN
jgi:translation elongation factor EF-G